MKTDGADEIIVIARAVFDLNAVENTSNPFLYPRIETSSLEIYRWLS